MQQDDFVGKVQQRARLSSRQEAEDAIRAVLTTLAQRLAGGAANNLAAQLPPGVARYLRATETQGRRVGPDRFIGAVGEREGAQEADAAFRTRAVFDVLEDATEGTLDKVRAQLPEELDAIFSVGTEGAMDLPEDYPRGRPRPPAGPPAARTPPGPRGRSLAAGRTPPPTRTAAPSPPAPLGVGPFSFARRVRQRVRSAAPPAQLTEPAWRRRLWAPFLRAPAGTSRQGLAVGREMVAYCRMRPHLGPRLSRRDGEAAARHGARAGVRGGAAEVPPALGVADRGDSSSRVAGRPTGALVPGCY